MTQHDEPTLDTMDSFSDNQLWAFVDRPLNARVDARLRKLTALGKLNQLSEAEEQELEHLIGEVDRYVLLRSQALFLLKQRGHDVEERLNLRR